SKHFKRNALGHHASRHARRRSFGESRLLPDLVEGDSECGQGRFFKLSRDSPVELFKGQTKRIQRAENISDCVSSKDRAFSQGKKLAAGINPGVAKALAERIRKPRYQWNIRSD